MSNNSYGYHEITDRCSIVICMIEDFILDHHLCTEEWKKLAEEAQDLIVKIYRQSSILGEMSDRDRQIQRDDSDLLPDNNEEVVRELLVAEAELDRYKQGVEVDDFVNRFGMLEAEYELPSHLRDKQVRVLVMKVEE